MSTTEPVKRQRRAAQFTPDEANPSWFPHVLRTLARDYPEINDKVWSTAIGENAAEQTAKRAQPLAQSFAADITGRARWAIVHNDGRPNPAWSTGERLIVALVIDDPDTLTEEDYTRHQVLERLAGDIGGTVAEAEAWIEEVQGRL
jgi:hypothetical protein